MSVKRYHTRVYLIQTFPAVVPNPVLVLLMSVSQKMFVGAEHSAIPGKICPAHFLRLFPQMGFSENNNFIVHNLLFQLYSTKNSIHLKGYNN